MVTLEVVSTSDPCMTTLLGHARGMRAELTFGACSWFWAPQPTPHLPFSLPASGPAPDDTPGHTTLLLQPEKSVGQRPCSFLVPLTMGKNLLLGVVLDSHGSHSLEKGKDEGACRQDSQRKAACPQPGQEAQATPHSSHASGAPPPLRVL